MTVQISRLCSGFVAATADAVHTVNDSTRTRIDAMTAVNTDTTVQTLTIYLVVSGGAPDDSNLILKQVSIAAGASLRIKEAAGHVLHSGGKIYAQASAANKIALYASGVEVS